MATTTTIAATTTSSPAVNPGNVDLASSRVPNRGKMTASWQTRPSSQWTYVEKLLIWLGITTPDNQSQPRPRPPAYPCDTPVPVYPVWKMHAMVGPKALAPVLVHHFFTQLTGVKVPVWLAVISYLVYYTQFAIGVFAWNTAMVDKFGTFDGAVPRDGIPDDATTSTGVGLLMVPISRMTIAVSVLYNPDEPVLDLKTLLMLPVNMAIYTIAVDFWFYWYHRLMHEVPWLWRLHAKHHRTKHPTAALSAFADHEQEVFDMVVIPVLAWLTWRINFATWFVSTCYILFVEASGHSGMRGYFQIPTVWFLRYVGADLCIEDHDLHHRQGWKTSGNYGKQTRLWDMLFGTKKPRIEGTEDNINWDDPMEEPQPVPVKQA
ncbi:hypothetical protein EX895_004232 [Sporisorium graminicola]|uniref:Fatty acid hydroxylase domain-containing protein n=1 Tax=Sporisorium graminicola TaxID=280036 RepID=A0A4U7KR74_9BASI|nr:hypothetical protein EX895_004232 [Sporisorium graminicola]TKY86944.1 hypothetical protein EX895_004232 [Sporisorium graminicola]